MKNQKHVIAAEEKIDLSDIAIGKDFNINQLESIQDDSSAKQKLSAKGLLIDLKQRILDIQFENLSDQDKLNKIEKQLKEHPVMKARTLLRKNINKKKKQIGDLMSVYTGALNMTKMVGVKLDARTLKELREATR